MLMVMVVAVVPLPMVAATVVSKMNIATNIQKAAQKTAILGGRAFVAMTDAIQFAASFMPFVKLNASAMSAVMRTITIILAVLDHYAADLGRYHLCHIRGILE